MEPNRKEIEELIHDKPASQIPLDKPVAPPPPVLNVIEQGKILWSRETQELLADFEYGLQVGKFGDNSIGVSVDKFLKRLREAITTSVAHICSKRNLSSEIFQLHSKALESILALIAKEIQGKIVSKELVSFDAKELIAVLHGFLEAYIHENVTRRQKVL